MKFLTIASYDVSNTLNIENNSGSLKSSLILLRMREIIRVIKIFTSEKKDALANALYILKEKVFRPMRDLNP